MNLETFAEKSLPNIGKYGIQNNSFLGFVKEKLNRGSRFYELIPSGEILQRFAEDVSNKRIELSDATFEQSDKKDYWNRGDTQSFLYTARILPELEKKYRKVYEEVTEGSGILPAGLDRVSQRNPIKKNGNGELEGEKTIWNIVQYTEGEGIEPSKSSTGRKRTGTERKFLQMDQKQKNKYIGNSIKNIDNSVSLTNDQLTAVSTYITNLLRDI